jgi:hypothetical protein
MRTDIGDVIGGAPTAGHLKQVRIGGLGEVALDEGEDLDRVDLEYQRRATVAPDAPLATSK